MRKLLRHCLAVGALCLVLPSCGGTLETDPRVLPTVEASGVWLSTVPAGALGTLELTLDRREDSRVYDAELTSQTGGGLGADSGYGTLADGHLILDFGSGQENEYYFEGQVESVGNTATSIEGQFVFPGQEEVLAVTFAFQSALPAE